jgi:hypothetical protein
VQHVTFAGTSRRGAEPHPQPVPPLDFALLMHEFRRSRLLRALVYVPIMWAVLLLFSIALIGQLYGIDS